MAYRCSICGKLYEDLKGTKEVHSKVWYSTIICAKCRQRNTQPKKYNV